MNATPDIGCDFGSGNVKTMIVEPVLAFVGHAKRILIHLANAYGAHRCDPQALVASNINRLGIYKISNTEVHEGTTTTAAAVAAAATAGATARYRL